MRIFTNALFFTLIIAFSPPSFTQKAAFAQQEGSEGIRIDAPLPGEALQGNVTITGSTQVDGFLAAELTFTYANDTTGTWFLVAEMFAPVENDVLAVWDTFALTDGDYILQLTVYLADGSRQVALVEGLRMRNYSAVETSTPAPTETPTPVPTADPRQFTPTPTPTITVTPTPTPLAPTPTPLPSNPAEISPDNIANSLLRGAAGALAGLLILGFYLSLRRKKHE